MQLSNVKKLYSATAFKLENKETKESSGDRGLCESLKVGTVTTRSEADIVRVHWKYQTHDMLGCFVVFISCLIYFLRPHLWKLMNKRSK